MIRIVVSYKNCFEKVEKLIAFMEQNSIKYDYYSYIPVKRFGRKLDSANHSIKLSALIFGFIGFISAMLFQYWSSVEYYRQNIGNREFFSWVTALPISFEIAILMASLSAFIAFMVVVRSDKGKSVDFDTKNLLILIRQGEANSVINILKTNSIDFEIMYEDVTD